MKKIKKLLTVAMVCMMALMCVGCGSADKTVVLTYEEADLGVSYHMTLEASFDVIKKMTQITTIDVAGYTQEQVEYMQSTMDEFEEQYSKYEGVSYSTSIEGTQLKETIIIETTDSKTLEELNEAGLYETVGEGAFISLDKTIDNLESQGWKVSE